MKNRLILHGHIFVMGSYQNANAVNIVFDCKLSPIDDIIVSELLTDLFEENV